MPGSVRTTGIELDQREEVDAVDRQRGDRDEAEDAVEDQQEQRDDDEARDARDEALVERLLAERRGHLRARDELQLDRQRAGLQNVRELLRGLDREAALDLRAGPPVDAVGVAAEVDERRRDELVVEHDREVLVDLLGRLAGQDAALSWPRWAICLVTRCQVSRPLSVNSNVTIGAPVPPAPWSKFCSGFLMSVPSSATSSFSTYHWSSFAELALFCARTMTVPGLTTITVALSTGHLRGRSASARGARRPRRARRTASPSASTT